MDRYRALRCARHRSECGEDRAPAGTLDWTGDGRDTYVRTDVRQAKGQPARAGLLGDIVRPSSRLTTVKVAGSQSESLVDVCNPVQNDRCIDLTDHTDWVTTFAVLTHLFFRGGGGGG